MFCFNQACRIIIQPKIIVFLIIIFTLKSLHIFYPKVLDLQIFCDTCTSLIVVDRVDNTPLDY